MKRTFSFRRRCPHLLCMWVQSPTLSNMHRNVNCLNKSLVSLSIFFSSSRISSHFTVSDHTHLSLCAPLLFTYSSPVSSSAFLHHAFSGPSLRSPAHSSFLSVSHALNSPVFPFHFPVCLVPGCNISQSALLPAFPSIRPSQGTQIR